MKGPTIDSSIRLLKVFSVKTVADLCGEDEHRVRTRLDRLVDRGTLRRRSQWGAGLPDVYYHASV